ncbi:MAG: ABC transporter substrate-binding protein [Planctomycetota bacterium]
MQIKLKTPIQFSFKLTLLTLVWLSINSISICQEAATSIDKLPTIEQEPFDLIELDDSNANVKIKILPLKKKLADPLPTSGLLVFDAPDLSDDRLQVPFENVVKYRSFNDLLREEANQYIREQQFGKAFRNLIYIYDHGGKNDPALKNTIQNLLFRDAAKNYFDGKYELALSIFQDLYEKDPNFKATGISKKPLDLILECQDKNVAANFEKGQYAMVRAAIFDLQARYGESAKKIAAKWQERLQQQNQRLANEARNIANRGDGKLAHLTARRASSILPGRDESLQLFQEIVEKYPIIFVGVSQTTAFANPLSLDHWSARRLGKLTDRSVVEFTGPGDDGGKYNFLNGRIEQIDDNGFEFRFTIEPDNESFAVPPIDAFELSRKILNRGSIRSKDYYVPLAKVIDSVEIENEYSVIVRFRLAFIKPEALFQFAYDSPESIQNNGAYVLAEQNEEIMVFEKNDRYPDLPNQQHPQVIEWKFPSASQAVSALIAGEIDVVDRIVPADLNRLKKNAAIEVGSYIVPTVHMLVPNERNDFTQDRSFRNGLKHGINRELILRDVICGGREVSGCEIISGPFPIGTEENDQLSYAYNLGVTPQPFNDRLGMVLVRVVLETKISNLIRQGVEAPKVEFPTLVLAHPDDQISEMACVNIQQMWEAMGLSVVLRKIKDATPEDEDWDFLYYQMSMEEPLTDVHQLFGRDGVVENISAPVEQNMQKIGYADSWQNAGKTLRRIHRQVVNDVAIIPLWQIQEHYAYRDNVQGIEKNPVHIYQNVDRWKIVARKKAE